ncbi:MAG: hypothetical protein PVJ70_08575 [Syntrophobacterales bacterium]
MVEIDKEIGWMSSEGISKVKLFYSAVIALLLSLQIGCAGFRGKQYHHFETQTALKGDQTLILGFLGGLERWNDESRGVRKLATKINSWKLSNVHIETLENRKSDLAIKFIRNTFDHDQNGFLDDRERNSARLILYGHSLGGAAVVEVSRELKKMGVPILLTVQIDSVDLIYGDHIIPSNVKRAANLFQNDGWLLRGEDKIEPENPDKTEIIANIRFDYRTKNIDMSSLSWERRLFSLPHTKMDADPEVWARVEQMILSELVDNTDQIFARDKSLSIPPALGGKFSPHQQERRNGKCLIAMQDVISEGCQSKGS